MRRSKYQAFVRATNYKYEYAIWTKKHSEEPIAIVGDFHKRENAELAAKVAVKRLEEKDELAKLMGKKYKWKRIKL